MNLFEHAERKHMIFQQTGSFTSEPPLTVAALPEGIFAEVDALNPDVNDYRPIAVELLAIPGITKFRRVTGGHSAAIARGTLATVSRDEPTVRAGKINAYHWSVKGDGDGNPTTSVMRPHIDDSFSVPGITYFGVLGLAMLYHPGSFTLDMERLLDEGLNVSPQLFRAWEKRRSYSSFAQIAGRDYFNLANDLRDVYAQQIEAQEISAVEAPVNEILVVDNQFLHCEPNLQRVVGAQRGIIRRFVNAANVRV